MKLFRRNYAPVTYVGVYEATLATPIGADYLDAVIDLDDQISRFYFPALSDS